jgi:hypothetical protein
MCPFYFGVKRMYSSVLEMLEVNKCFWCVFLCCAVFVCTVLHDAMGALRVPQALYAAAAAAAAMQTMGREHRDMDVPALIAQLKKSHRWHVETA